MLYFRPPEFDRGNYFLPLLLVLAIFGAIVYNFFKINKRRARLCPKCGGELQRRDDGGSFCSACGGPTPS